MSPKVRRSPKTTNEGPEGSAPKRQHMEVFHIRETKSGSFWDRAGVAFVNRDGSLNVTLHMLPVDGKLHIRLPRDGAQTDAPGHAEVAPPEPF